ncbi:MAG TPA: bL35 family ribosomal protein [Tepidisphaeraceae bacterium]|nr:bL35 family ribosomal protein [Tepidisphaeraceae bacterium]
MGYKYKPSKAVKSRFKATGTGKLKHRHTHNSHLLSNRSGDQKRRNGRPAVLAEGHSKNQGPFLWSSRERPRQIAHKRALAVAEAAAAE